MKKIHCRLKSFHPFSFSKLLKFPFNNSIINAEKHRQNWKTSQVWTETIKLGKICLPINSNRQSHSSSPSPFYSSWSDAATWNIFSRNERRYLDGAKVHLWCALWNADGVNYWSHNFSLFQELCAQSPKIVESWHWFILFESCKILLSAKRFLTTPGHTIETSLARMHLISLFNIFLLSSTFFFFTSFVSYRLDFCFHSQVFITKFTLFLPLYHIFVFFVFPPPTFVCSCEKCQFIKTTKMELKFMERCVLYIKMLKS